MNFGIIYIFLLIIFLIGGYIVPQHKLQKYFAISDFFIALPAFFVQPKGNIFWDTVRFSQLLDMMRFYNTGGLRSGLNWALNYSQYATQPFDAFYIWLYSLFTENGYLFFINTYIFLILLSTVIIKNARLYKFKKNSAVFTEFFILILFNLFFQIEGIRNFLAFMILATAVTIDINTVNKKKRSFSILLYILAYLLHPACAPFILIRLILFFKSKIVMFVSGIICLFYMIFFKGIINVLSQHSFLSNIADKAQWYNQYAFAGKTEFLVTSLLLGFLLIELIIFNSLNVTVKINKKYMLFYYLVIAFTIGSVINTQLYLRSIMLILFLSIPIKEALLTNVVAICKDNRDYIKVYLYRVSLIIVSLIMFIYWYLSTYSKVLVVF